MRQEWTLILQPILIWLPMSSNKWMVKLTTLILQNALEHSNYPSQVGSTQLWKIKILPDMTCLSSDNCLNMQ